MKYIRECALPTCNKKFETNRDWQKFCCRSHQREYWIRIQADKYETNRRLEEIEKEQEKKKKKLGIK